MSALTGVRHFNVPDLDRVEGSLLLASNHQSFLDPVLVGMALPRPLNFAARSTLFTNPAFGTLIRALGAHPLQRDRVDPRGIRTLLRLLRDGRRLLVFPEGTRTRDGALNPFRPGTGVLAVRTGTPVLPVCIEGAQRAWPRHRLLPRPARVAVAFGEIIHPDGRTGEELMKEVEASVYNMQRYLRDYCDHAADGAGHVQECERICPAPEHT
jgi:1-acyl-sn-glycerol-3-phosphate acyltransferase